MHTLKILTLRGRPRGPAAARLVRHRLRALVEDVEALRVRPRRGALGGVRWEPARPRFDDHLALRVEPNARRRREAIEAFAEARLPRDRPLWAVLVLEDPLRRELTVVAKVHHALVDGRAAAALIERAFGRPLPPATPARRLRVLAALGAALSSALAALGRLVFRFPRGATRPFGAARPSFARPVRAGRRVGTARLPLEGLRRLKSDAGATLNDVYLTLVTGALRGYLEARGERVDRPLVAAVPLGAPSLPYASGNRLSFLLVELPIDEAVPERRLERVRRSAGAAKSLAAALGTDLLIHGAALVPPVALRGLWRALRALGLSPVDLIVSNVPGPKGQLRAGGLELVGLASTGPLLETAGLNLTAWSHADELTVTVLASEGLADADAIAARLRAEAEALAPIALTPAAPARAEAA